jgi:hypothetical protein
MNANPFGCGRPIWQPDVFSGGYHEDPCTWLEKYRKAIRIYQWDDDQALRHVSAFLSGTAENWFESKSQRFRNWNDFETAFRAKYLDKTYEEQAWNTLQSFKMKKTDKMEDVVAKIENLFKRANVTDETTKLRLFRQALLPQYQKVLVEKNIKTFKRAARRVIRLATFLTSQLIIGSMHPAVTNHPPPTKRPHLRKTIKSTDSWLDLKKRRSIFLTV